MEVANWQGHLGTWSGESVGIGSSSSPAYLDNNVLSPSWHYIGQYLKQHMFLRLFTFIFVDLLVQRTIRGNELRYARKVTRFQPWPIEWELSCSSKCHAGILSSIGSGDHCALSHLTTCTDCNATKVGFKGLALKGQSQNLDGEISKVLFQKRFYYVIFIQCVGGPSLGCLKFHGALFQPLLKNILVQINQQKWA